MKTISALLDRAFDFKPKPVARHHPNVEVLTAPLRSVATGRPAAYEDEVFNFLLGNKKALGIESVSKFKNLLLDGQIILADKRRFVIEIKLRMNWLKACQAEWQFRQFLKRRRHDDSPPVSGGIVFFESFTSDWARPVGGVIRGWKHWSLYHAELDDMRIHLVQFRDNELSGCPD
jgi:hypothetical protein